ncbi:MAG: 2-phospho-L-lactate guanylyltransferase [Anaerolineales bacterium]|nr:2-phospho-L-lactate guanylyltransferase [Anaerolineales bacterium]
MDDMTLWAIVPVKPFMLAKSRLAGSLTPQQRSDLSRRLLLHTLDVLARVPLVRRTLVVSRDSAALALARKARANTVTESTHSELDLNLALRRATEAALAFGVRAVLILPADLPQLTPADVELLLNALAPASMERTAVIAPDRHERGTNALLVRPPDLMRFAFGPDSFREHVRRANAVGAQVRVVRAPNLALDLDTPEDWALMQGYTSVVSAR